MTDGVSSEDACAAMLPGIGDGGDGLFEKFAEIFSTYTVVVLIATLEILSRK